MAEGRKKDAAQRKKCDPGFLAKANGKTLRSYEVATLPIINYILRRMRLPEILKEFLPASDARTELPAYRTLLVLLRNILLSREPFYGLGQWASRFAPDLLGLYSDKVELLNDDRAGRALEQMFDALVSELTVTVVRQVIDEFRVNMDELHNDSTSVSFY